MEGKEMKTKSSFIILLGITVFFISVFAFCEDRNEDDEKEVTATVLKYTKCKIDAMNFDRAVEESLEYFVRGHELYITRYNEAYNCCDSVLKIDVIVTDHKIVIEELGESPCDCICIRDAEYKVSDIPSGHYVVEILGREGTFEIDIK